MAEMAPGMSAMAPGGATPSREAMRQFLVGGTEMMRSAATRALLKDPKILKPGEKLIELQRNGWDALGVDRDLGCKALDSVDPNDPADHDLIVVRQEFVHTAMRTYLQSLEDRRPKRLEKKAAMPRATIIEFFDSCNTKMDLPETLEMLKKHLETTKQVPNKVIIELQRDQLEILGFERDHGCAMLSRIPQDFPNDAELMRRFEVWQRKAHATCTRAMRESEGFTPPEMAQNPEMARLMERAREEIQAMTPQERGELIEKMQRKVQTLMNLPHESQKAYIQKLGEAEKLEIVKAQILMVSFMRQQMEEQQRAGGAPGAPEAPAMAPPSVAPPSQMTM